VRFKKNIQLWLWLLAWLITVSDCFGQNGLSLIYAPSKVIKHRSNLLFDVPDRTHEFRMAYTYRTQGRYKWQRYWNHPTIAVNGVFVDFGDPVVLGRAYGVLPELHFTLTQCKNWRLNLQFGTGIAYLNRPFDAISNPKNNAIGSNLNNISSLKFGLAYDWHPRWATTLSGGLVHFSNGLSSSPNSGINIYGVSLSGSYTFETPKQADISPNFLNFAERDTSFKRWIADVQYHYGFTEHPVPGGPKYGVHAFSLGAGYRYTEFMSILMGGEYEFNEGTYTFFRRNFTPEEEALDRARSTIIYVEHELRFGYVFNRLRMGFYLPWPRDNSRRIYTKVITGLYLPGFKRNARPYIGVLLKTHVAIADYLGIVGGISF